jgi:hypothetical protein
MRPSANPGSPLPWRCRSFIPSVVLFPQPIGGERVSEFRTEISNRIAQARGDLSEAAATGDDYLVELSLGALESLARIALEHDLPIDGVEEDLASYGLPTPARGLPQLPAQA